MMNNAKDKEEVFQRIGEIYATFEKRLAVYCMKKLAEPYKSQAEDVVQVAFEKLLNYVDESNLDIFDENRVYRFLWVVARNCCYNINRNSKKMYSVEPGQMEYRVVNHNEDTVVSRMSLNDLLDIVDTLPRKNADVLFLHSVMELSYPEIASLLNIHQDTVRQRMCRARAKMQILLEGANG